MGGVDDLRAAQRNGHRTIPPAELHRIVLDTVRMEPVEFLVPGRVPYRGVTLIVGDPGLGKSTWTCYVAADASHHTTVAMVNAEDSLPAVVVPRLRAAGANLARIEALSATVEGTDRIITLPGDVALIEEFVVDTGSRLIVLDPLMAFVSERVDTNQDHAIRRALAALADMADRRDVAVLVAGHLNKDEQKSLVYRVGGSIGLVGAARSILLFARDPDDPEGMHGHRRLLAHAKTNWSALASTLRYAVEETTVEQDGEFFATTRLAQAEDPIAPYTAEELVGRRREPGKAEDAMDAILDELADGEPHPSRDVKHAARGLVGCGLRTVDRAAEELRARGELVSEGEGKATTWRTPPTNRAKSLSEDGGVVRNPVVEPNRNHAANGGEGDGTVRDDANRGLSAEQREQLRMRMEGE
jgi:AAA domain